MSKKLNQEDLRQAIDELTETMNTKLEQSQVDFRGQLEAFASDLTARITAQIESRIAELEETRKAASTAPTVAPFHAEGDLQPPPPQRPGKAAVQTSDGSSSDPDREGDGLPGRLRRRLSTAPNNPALYSDGRPFHNSRRYAFAVPSSEYNRQAVFDTTYGDHRRPQGRFGAQYGNKGEGNRVVFHDDPFDDEFQPPTNLRRPIPGSRVQSHGADYTGNRWAWNELFDEEPDDHPRQPPGYGDQRFCGTRRGDRRHLTQDDRGLKLRVDPPKFSGTDPHTWMFQVEQYFNYYRVASYERLELVGVLLSGEAADWFRYKQTNRQLTTWQNFLDEVKIRFDPQYYHDYFGHLSKLKQETTVIAYQAEFEKLLNKIDDTPEQQLISLYTSGLKPPLSRKLELRKPRTLASAFSLARELEATISETASVWDTYRTPSQPQDTTPTTINTTATVQSKPPTVPSTPPIKRLSYAEQMERRRLGLCFNCDMKYTPGHKCEGKFLLLGCDDSEPVPQDDVVVAADASRLFLLTHSDEVNSLRLRGSVGGRELSVLIDSGSTHNFLHPELAAKFELPLRPIAPFKVLVGNGDYLRCDATVGPVDLLIQGYTFPVEFHILQLHGPQGVLGMRWLKQFQKIETDYTKMQVTLHDADSRVFLQGLTKAALGCHRSYFRLEDKPFPNGGGVDTGTQPSATTEPKEPTYFKYYINR